MQSSLYSIGITNTQPADRPALLVIGMYTDSHRGAAERLAASLARFGLPFSLYQVPAVHRSISLRGSVDATYAKHSLIRHVLDTRGVPVLYLDCDCVVREAPRLLGSLVESGSEFAIYNWLADEHTDAFEPVQLRDAAGQPLGSEARFFRFSHALDAFSPAELISSGGAQFYADTPGARALLDTWRDVIEQHPGVPDDQCLDVAFNFRLARAARPRATWLPKSYLRILYWIYVRPVIDHPQLPSAAAPPDPPHIPLPLGPRFHAEWAESRIGGRLIPRDCIVDVQARRLLRIRASTQQTGAHDIVDVGPLVHELFLAS